MKVKRWIIIPGFMKAGSTSVFSWLEDVFVASASRPKEPCFFLGDMKDPAELDRYWREASGGSDTAIDGSVAYLDPKVSAGVAERISAAAVDGPEPRFIVLVRDPIERAVSHIRHDMRRGRIGTLDPASAAGLIRPGRPYFERSRLGSSIKPFIETFPPDNLLILPADCTDQEKLSTISAFLSMPELIALADTGRRNEASLTRSYTPALAWLSERRLLPRAERLVPKRVRPLAARALLRPPVGPIDVQSIRSLLPAETMAQLEEDAQEFDKMTAHCRPSQ